jgi:hypothetical protein
VIIPASPRTNLPVSRLAEAACSKQVVVVKPGSRDGKSEPPENAFKCDVVAISSQANRLDANDNCDFLRPPPGPWNRCLEAQAAKAARPASFPLLPSLVVHEVQVDVVVRNLVALMTVRQILNGDVVD